MKSTEKCPSFTVISAAAAGNAQAIEKILKRYDAYISKASLRPKDMVRPSEWEW